MPNKIDVTLDVIIEDLDKYTDRVKKNSNSGGCSSGCGTCPSKCPSQSSPNKYDKNMTVAYFKMDIKSKDGRTEKYSDPFAMNDLYDPKRSEKITMDIKNFDGVNIVFENKARDFVKSIKDVVTDNYKDQKELWKVVDEEIDKYMNPKKKP